MTHVQILVVVASSQECTLKNEVEKKGSTPAIVHGLADPHDSDAAMQSLAYNAPERSGTL